METKLKFYFLFSLVLFSCGASRNRQGDTNEVSTTNALKDYAFCSCIRHEFGDSLIIGLNEGSLSSYMSTSDYDLDEFSTIDSISKIYVDSITYQSKNQRSLGLKKCLDFYNGAYLKGYLNEINSK